MAATQATGFAPLAACERMPVAHRPLLARTWGAFAATCVRHRASVATPVRRELARWEQEARVIADPRLRTLALSKLAAEGFNAEAASMLATLAPRRHRAAAVQAIVALEVLFDYLDGRTESEEPATARRLFATFTAAVAEHDRRDTAGRGEALEAAACKADGRYLAELTAAAQDALDRLPDVDAVRPTLQHTAARAAEAQIRLHCGTDPEGWALLEQAGTGLEWRAFLAGAGASVLACHAVIAAAGNASTTAKDAATLDAAYLPACALATLLDGVVDHEADACAAVGGHGYADLYPDQEELAATLTGLAIDALARLRGLHHGARHIAILAGVVAYYTTAPGARSGFAEPVLAGLRARLRPLMVPMLIFMRAWRSATRA